MRRRALLSTLATAALPLAAGCAGRSDAGTPTDRNTATTDRDVGTNTGSTETTQTATATDDPTDERTTGDPTSVTVENVAVQQGYVVREVADAIGVVGDDSRYLWVAVAVDGAAQAPDAFVLDAGFAEYEPVAEPRAYRFESGDTAYARGLGRGLLLFELPLDVERSRRGEVPPVSLTWPGGASELDPAVAKRIVRDPPTLSVSIHDRYEETPATPIAVEVTNDGGADRDLDSRFVGALNRRGPAVAVTPVQRVAVDVPAGESRTVEIEDDWHDRTPDGSDVDGGGVEYALHWAGDSTRVAIEDV